MDLKQIYKDCGAYLQGHFLLSSGKHSEFYLQSAKVLEDPKRAEVLCSELAKIITNSGIEFDSVCSPALGGLLAGYELARILNKRFIFTERKDGQMCLRRGFEVKKGERFLVCEDIITTGGSALECSEVLAKQGASIIAFAALANRGFCKVSNLNNTANNAKKANAKLPDDISFFALGNFDFEIYEKDNCPMCKNKTEAIKPGSR